METKHTPGPWHYRSLDEWTHNVVTNHGTLPDGDPDDLEIARVNMQRERHEANARLIAAAPDLLEALETLWETANELPSCAKHAQMVRQAISKAKGE